MKARQPVIGKDAKQQFHSDRLHRPDSFLSRTVQCLCSPFPWKEKNPVKRYAGIVTLALLGALAASCGPAPRGDHPHRVLASRGDARRDALSEME